MDALVQQAEIDFFLYPSVGDEDWQYAFETAEVRALETAMLPRSVLVDMANAAGFEQAAGLLAGGEYAFHHGGKSLADMENILKLRRSAVRKLFEELMIDKSVVELFRARDDFANLRLALRRILTEESLGTDYSGEGSVSPQIFWQAFEEENYQLFPDYMAEAAEQATLEYYQNKNIRWVDYAIDRFQAEYNLKKAHRLKRVFLSGLFRMQIDLTNIRTLLRLKFTESQQRDVFLKGGFVEPERFIQGMELGYEGLGTLFFPTPYYEVVEAGVSYLRSNKSFLGLERRCEEHLLGFLESTRHITAGPQPVIAYLLMKENEIRNVRLVLTAKKNFLETKFILDRIS